MEQQTKVGTAVIIVRGKRVLLCKRLSKLGTNTWGFPGGHVEFGERLEDCAVRETAEETGLVVENPRVLSAVSDVIDGKHYITVFLVAENMAGGEARIMEPEKCGGWEWFEWDALPQPLFPSIISLLARNVSPF